MNKQVAHITRQGKQKRAKGRLQTNTHTKRWKTNGMNSKQIMNIKKIYVYIIYIDCLL